MKIYPNGDEKGKEFTMVGWGDSGIAGVKPKKVVSDGKFRRAKNIVDEANEMLIYTLDAPEDDALDLEGMSWLGDSGIIFLNFYIEKYIRWSSIF